MDEEEETGLAEMTTNEEPPSLPTEEGEGGDEPATLTPPDEEEGVPPVDPDDDDVDQTDPPVASGDPDDEGGNEVPPTEDGETVNDSERSVEQSQEMEDMTLPPPDTETEVSIPQPEEGGTIQDDEGKPDPAEEVTGEGVPVEVEQVIPEQDEGVPEQGEGVPEQGEVPVEEGEGAPEQGEGVLEEDEGVPEESAAHEEGEQAPEEAAMEADGAPVDGVVEVPEQDAGTPEESGVTEESEGVPVESETPEGGEERVVETDDVTVGSTEQVDTDSEPLPQTDPLPADTKRDPEPVETQQTDPELGLSRDTTQPPPTADRRRISAVSEARSRSTLAPANQTPMNPLELTWSFGVNHRVPAINLSDNKRKMVLYCCAYAAVVYEYENNRQTLLQGHCNAITCMAASRDRRWAATADQGRNCSIIAWDTYTGIPVQTLFVDQPGTAALALTNDARYMATVSSGSRQVISIWDWTTESNTPIHSVTLQAGLGVQNYIIFNPDDPTQLVSNSDSYVVFYSWSDGVQFKYFAPPLTDQVFNRAVGAYSQSIFQQYTTRVLTTTRAGNIVVWDNNRPHGLPNVGSVADKKPFKLVHLQEKALTVLTVTDQFIVTADVGGHVRFYDTQLQLFNWYQDFGVGPINSVSFAHNSDFVPEELEPGDYPPDATIAARKFIVRDFVIGTTNACVALVTADGTKVDLLHSEHNAEVNALACHPGRSHVCIGGFSGLLKVWDYEAKVCLVSRRFGRADKISCVSYDPSGTYVAVGFSNGTLRVVDALTLEDDIQEPFHFSHDEITHCSFSYDSGYLATGDKDRCVVVYRADVGNMKNPFKYLGKQRTHYKQITGVMFGVALDSKVPRLLSLGHDRVLVEYDLENSVEDDLKVMSSDRIEQSAVPLCLTSYPPIVKEDFIVTANDQFKLKLYNSTTKMCRKTILAPTYGTPLQQIAVLPTTGDISENRYMAFVTTDKVGLHRLPLDGNPHNAMAVIAHPQGVKNLVCSFDGKYIFTAGGIDGTVHMWLVSTGILDIAARLGGDDLIPFYGLLDGGREGELFKELEDFFYYAQIRSQGVNTKKKRVVSTTIALSEVPFVMRAIGFYPSEQEIDDMLNEVKFGRYVETGKYVSDIDLGDFLKLYINHRPAFGLSPHRLSEAFQTLGRVTHDQRTVLDRGELLHILQSMGENMTESELAEYLSVLLGVSSESASVESGVSYDPEDVVEMINEQLPSDITAEMFASDLLGFSFYRPGSGGQSDRSSHVHPV